MNWPAQNRFGRGNTRRSGDVPSVVNTSDSAPTKLRTRLPKFSGTRASQRYWYKLAGDGFSFTPLVFFNTNPLVFFNTAKQPLHLTTVEVSGVTTRSPPGGGANLFRVAPLQRGRRKGIPSCLGRREAFRHRSERLWLAISDQNWLISIAWILILCMK